jgi:hypothetical protein
LPHPCRAPDTRRDSAFNNAQDQHRPLQCKPAGSCCVATNSISRSSVRTGMCEAPKGPHQHAIMREDCSRTNHQKILCMTAAPDSSPYTDRCSNTRPGVVVMQPPAVQHSNACSDSITHTSYASSWRMPATPCFAGGSLTHAVTNALQQHLIKYSKCFTRALFTSSVQAVLFTRV